MDLAIVAGLGLSAVGYFLNKDGKQARTKEELDEHQKDAQLENKKGGGNNVYDMGYFQKVKEIEDDHVIPNFEKSFDPINTNIIPRFFNTLNETQVKRVKNPNYDKDLFHKELSKIMKTTPIELAVLEPTVNDLTDINQDGSLESGGWAGSPPKGLYAETELNRNWGTIINRPAANRGDGNRDGAPPMTHNNMVPFFGGSSRQNMNMENRMLDDKLENFTGQFRMDQQHKKEVETMFAPVQQDIYQTLEPREMDRFVSSTQIRNNELPFEQIQVGHGLNDGYTARPTGGFHNPLRILPKTIDQLLVNPKVVKEGRVIRGKDPVDQRTAQQIQYKYTPECLVTNFDGERNFTTTGVQQKPMVRSGIVQKPTSRQKSKELIGPAMTQDGSKRVAIELQPKVKRSGKRNFLNTEYRNPVQAESGKGLIDYLMSYVTRPNERDTTQKHYIQQGLANINAVAVDGTMGVVHPKDKAKKTRKQSYVLAQNPTGYVSVGGGTGVKSQVYNPFSTAKTTVRETTENNTHQGNVQADGVKGQVYNPFDLSKTTHRETTEDNNHQGYVNTEGVKGQVYNPFDLSRTTHRETTEDNTHQGQIKTDGVKGKVYNPFDLTRTTVRETTEANDHMGPMGQVELTKGQVYDPNDQMRTTIKETTEKGDYVGVIGSSEHNKQIVYDPFDCPQTTHRETTEDQRYINGTQSTTLQNGTGYETAPTDIRNTQRQFYSQWYHVNSAGQADAPGNPQMYDAAYNMRQDVEKEVVAEGRAPTLSGVKLGPGKVDVSIEIKKLERDQVNQYSAMRAPISCNQALPADVCQMTSYKNALPPTNTYFDPAILKPFIQNPLAQSLQSWA